MEEALWIKVQESKRAVDKAMKAAMRHYWKPNARELVALGCSLIGLTIASVAGVATAHFLLLLVSLVIK